MTGDDADELRLYRAILARAWDVTWIFDAKGRVTYASPNRMLAGPLLAPLGELSLEHIVLAARADEREKIRAAFAQALEAPPHLPVFLDVHATQADGSERDRECVILNRLDDPDIRGILVQTHDIGVLNEPRRKKADAERRFRALFEATSAAVTIRDVATQTFLDCNEAALRIYGAKSVDELRALKPNDLAPPMQPDGASSIEGLRRAVEQATREGAWSGQWLARRLTGETFTARIRISRIDLDDGAVFQSIVEDVSDLAHAREEALAASRAKSAFLATMSHELRSPLNGVIGMVDLLSATSLDERQRRYAEVALASARGLLSIIGDILDFSKIEAGKLEIGTEPFRLQDVIDEASSVLALAAEERGIALVCSLDPALRGRLLGDAARIRQVLVNFIGNAVKFTDAGSVHVRALAHDVVERGVVLRIEVEDTGPGVAPADAGRIFAPFAQVDSPGTRQRGGTGLGLAICHEIVQTMGGTIGVQSVPGSGSTFWFQVRLARGPGDSYAVRWENDAKAKAILVVARHALVRDTLDRAIVTRGARAESAATIEAAHQRLLETPFAAVIVVDEGEPFDARTLVSHMAAVEGLGDTRIVFVESLRRPLDMAEVRAFRITAHCPKPVWSARLEEILGEILFETGPRNATYAASSSEPGASVLVVDDSALNAEVTREILRSAGYRVVVASSGEDALVEVTRTPFDLVLLDRYLPGIDGYETARRIRALEHERRTRSPQRLPLVSLTASATPDDSDLSRAAGMDGHISKPIERARLLQVTSQHVTASRSRRARAPSGAPRPAPVDFARALARVGGEAAILRRAAVGFLEIAPGSWALLRAAIERRDRVAVEFAAHRLRGQASMFDALDLVEALRAIEELAEKEQWQRSELAVAQAENALNEALRALGQETASSLATT
ncbi:MAG: ATP-binding protein [Polyangiaceae bacterium]